jgi:hypothetical protein
VVVSGKLNNLVKIKNKKKYFVFSGSYPSARLQSHSIIQNSFTQKCTVGALCERGQVGWISRKNASFNKVGIY